VSIGLIAVWLSHGGLAWAGTAACAATVSADASAISLATRIVVDPSTGAIMSLVTATPGHLVIRLVLGKTMISRDLSAAGSLTTIKSGAETVTLRNDGKTFAMTNREGLMRASVSDQAMLGKLFERLRASRAAEAARHLLDAVSLQPNSVEGNAMMLTHAMLGSAWGDERAAHAYQQWMAAKGAQPRVVRAGDIMGPGECWDQYAAEAIRIANDYIDCANSCQWLVSFCLDGCGFLFELRAEAALMWFLDCSGGFYVG
jgi:hypothetical protein